MTGEEEDEEEEVEVTRPDDTAMAHVDDGDGAGRASSAWSNGHATAASSSSVVGGAVSSKVEAKIDAAGGAAMASSFALPFDLGRCDTVGAPKLRGGWLASKGERTVLERDQGREWIGTMRLPDEGGEGAEAVEEDEKTTARRCVGGIESLKDVWRVQGRKVGRGGGFDEEAVGRMGVVDARPARRRGAVEKGRMSRVRRRNGGNERTEFLQRSRKENRRNASKLVVVGCSACAG